MSEKLVKTNYDNFKDCKFLMQQYKKAQEMQNEVNGFINSFIMSKLLTAKDLEHISPNIIDHYHWINSFIFPDYEYDYLLLNILKDNKDAKHDEKELEEKTGKSVSEVKKEVKEYMAGQLQDFSKIISTQEEYDCYFVLDRYNILHEFIPVSAKDSISVEYEEGYMIISGYFYVYDGYPVSWKMRNGAWIKEVRQLKKKIYINEETNNVDKVISFLSCPEKTDSAYPVDKKYYAATKNQSSTTTYKCPLVRRMIMKEYEQFMQENDSMDKFNKNKKTLEEFNQELLEKYSFEFKKVFKRDLTIDYVSKAKFSRYE